MIPNVLTDAGVAAGDGAPSAAALAAWDAAAGVVDPELPMVTIAELGILRGITVDGTAATVTITPTYSGCPATEAIAADVATALEHAGFDPVAVEVQLAPAWTTDWITADGRRQLAAAGIAPPAPVDRGAVAVRLRLGAGAVAPPVPCPRCGSHDTAVLSRFGSTACKALHRCHACGEPFDHFRPH